MSALEKKDFQSRFQGLGNKFKNAKDNIKSGIDQNIKKVKDGVIKKKDK